MAGHQPQTIIVTLMQLGHFQQIKISNTSVSKVVYLLKNTELIRLFDNMIARWNSR